MIHIYTDGACRGNGREGARAAWAAVINGVCAHFGLLEGDLQTNNRAEITAVIKGLELAGQYDGPATLYSDSNITVRTLNEWLPKRRALGTAHELQNLDLLTTAEALLTARPVNIVHVRGHQVHPGFADREALERWTGNVTADYFATTALSGGLEGTITLRELRDEELASEAILKRNLY